MKRINLRGKKETKIMIMAMAMTVLLGNTALAAKDPVYKDGQNVKFQKFHINKATNSYRKVVKGTKNNDGQYLYVEVQNMYDDDGDKADYEYSWFKITHDNGQTVEKKLTKGEYTPIKLAYKVKKDTNTLTVSVKGNSEKVSAKISGYVYNFTGSSFGTNP